MSTLRNSVIAASATIGVYALTQVFGNAAVDKHCKNYLQQHSDEIKVAMQESG